MKQTAVRRLTLLGSLLASVLLFANAASAMR
jgi:hypothetical protein